MHMRLSMQASSEKALSLVVIRHAENPEAPVRHVVLGRDFEGTDLVNVNVLVAIDVLHGVTQAIAEEGNADRLSIPGLVAVQKSTMSTEPAAVKGARDGEDLTLFIGGVVDHPALGLGLVLQSSRGHGQMVSLTGVGQRRATLLENEVSSLGQVANDLLEAFLEPECVG